MKKGIMSENPTIRRTLSKAPLGSMTKRDGYRSLTPEGLTLSENVSKRASYSVFTATCAIYSTRPTDLVP